MNNEVLYEDEYFLIMNKPAGVPTQTANIAKKDMCSIAAAHLKKQAFLINRLDEPVGGPVIFAKSSEAAAKINRLITDNKIDKFYRAYVSDSSGKFKTVKEYTELKNYIYKDKNVAVIKPSSGKDIKEAVLLYKTCTEEKTAEEGVTVLDIKLLTGRFHQIRCQLSKLGCPILNDVKYGGISHSNYKKNEIGLKCFMLQFRHPYTKKDVRIKC